MIILIYSIFIVLYGSLVLTLYYSWGRIKDFDLAEKTKQSENIFLSVVIPVRNESENIIQLLSDINKQDISLEAFEVIVVDDSSTDDTVEKVKAHLACFNFQMKICHLKVEPDFRGSHKKRALEQGIKHSKGTYIVSTDGDCRVHPQWLSTLRSFITAKNPECITGPVTFEIENTLFNDLQIMEFAFLIGTGAASLHRGFANMCNGANLAFSKKAFYEVKGYEGNLHIPSGDDEFLMHKIFKRYPEKVFFLKSKNFIVQTKAKEGLKSLFYQRKRWAGKWKMYSDMKITLFAVFYFLLNVVFFIALMMLLLGKYPLWVFIVQAVARGFFDFIFIRPILKFLNKPFSYKVLAVAQCVYPFYTILLGIASNFGKYKWKGREIN